MPLFSCDSRMYSEYGLIELGVIVPFCSQICQESVFSLNILGVCLVV